MAQQQQQKTSTLRPFNDGRPLSIHALEDGRLCLVDEAKSAHVTYAWIEEGVASVPLPRPRSAYRAVPLLPIPEQYGSWQTKFIGGVSRTVRRVGTLRAQPKADGTTVLFAVHAPSAEAVVEALALHERMATSPLCITVGDTALDDEYGHVTEIVLHDAQDLERVAAVVARAGAQSMLETPSVNARRCLGIERLDRIGAHVVEEDEDETRDEGESLSLHGPRRGTENWRFSWMPASWTHVPLTWDHLVENVLDVPVKDLPPPLRQHAARVHKQRGHFAVVGTAWRRAVSDPGPKEWAARDRGEPQHPHRRILEYVPGLSEALAEVRTRTTEKGEGMREEGGRLCFEVATLEGWGVALPVPSRTLVRATDGAWYEPYDFQKSLDDVLNVHFRNTRVVSAALSDAQSKQLITAFYLLEVEVVSDPVLRRASSLVLYHYMKERGYTARWMGKYVQDALYVGNGDTFRRFPRMEQYAPHRLPATVLNKLCDREGRLSNRGSKGTRSKYKTEGRYEPKRRLKRSRYDEERMMATAVG